MFHKIDPKQSFPKLEEEILSFWKENQTFKKSLEQTKNKKRFNFYDGPPFATGLPHYGHILAMGIKDAIVRYKTMQGYYVPRVFGWDCHGLPVEYEVEKELGISGKPEIEKYGIDKFNQKCRDIVLRYTSEWNKTINRMGRWGDLENFYVTMDNNYIESIWSVFKSIWDKDLIYKGFKTMPYCPRCGTPLSNFETNQGYKDIEDISTYIKFKIKDKKFSDTYFLVWTTTPWTLSGNSALAVDKKLKYGIYKNKENNQRLIVLTNRAEAILASDWTKIKELTGKDLENLEYEPLYSHPKKTKDDYKVHSANFVTQDEGTGIIHIAPAYGEDDLTFNKLYHSSIFMTVNEEGKVTFGKGLNKFIKSADKDVKEDLQTRNLLFKEEKIRHNYPFCWRCDSPLMYYPISTWFIKVSKLREKLVKNNQEINWIPKHIKEGRFGKWLSDARDWAVSRNRYWGAPLPIWSCGEHTKVIGSIEELEKLSGQKVKDLHRPEIDKITIKCEKCGKNMTRISEVLDCWFESGSMPYAQFHYPFEDKYDFKHKFPADFIGEGLDQTRGWFYTLHVISTILFDKPAFYNCVVNGIILAPDGKKLSKKLRNYIEPEKVFESYGADGLRWFLLSSPAAVAEDVRFSDQNILETIRKNILILWNIYSYFITYIGSFDLKIEDIRSQQEYTILDKWILVRLDETILSSTKGFEEYNLPKAIHSIENLINDFSVWYLRRSRKRSDKTFFHVLYEVLFNITKLIAPISPFISEAIYQNLKDKNDTESIHLCKWPKESPRVESRELVVKLLRDMQTVREIVEKAHALRAEAQIKVRQPLLELRIKKKEIGGSELSQELLEIIAEEINVKSVVIDSKIKDNLYLNTKITPELKEEGLVREVIRQIQSVRKHAGLNPQDKVSIYIKFNNAEINNVFNKHETEILPQVIVNKVLKTIPEKPDFQEKTKDFDIIISQ